MGKELEYDGAKNPKVHYLFNTQNSAKGLKQSPKRSAKKFSTVADQVVELKPSIPVYFIRPNSIKRAAKFFLENFQTPKFASDILYSVKSNPDSAVLKHLFDAGVKNFDVASMAEVKLINELFGDAANMYFMHPVKSREAIFDAYFNHGIRDFSLDSFDELQKLSK